MAQGRGEFGYGSMNKPEANPFGDPEQISSDVVPAAHPGSGDGGQSDYSKYSQEISNGIFKISSNVTNLEKVNRQLGTQNDTMQLRNRIQVIMQQTSKQITETHKSLRRISNVLRQPSITKPQKFQVERLNNEFQDCIKRYDRLKGSDVNQFGVCWEKTANKMRSCPLPQKKMVGDSSTGYHDDDAQKPLMEDARRQEMQAQLQQQEAVIDYDSALFEEREEQIRQIEAAMLDVNEIFKDLSVMVSEQGEVIDSIEANIDTAVDNVESGKTQLQKASTYQKKARKKMCCLFIILAIVAAVVALILYLTLK
ncbi:syntaxin-7-like [Amphiura filiformis]|uniref:syntaxin-7-like n=1 Tax=Amphiura filiformis TaxID=82378 RepID=UPI003B21F396